MARELGEHRDAHLEIETIVRRAGPVLESFVQERIKLDGPMYRQIGPDLRHILTGKAIEEDFAPAEVRKNWPHGFSDWVPDDPDQLMHLYSEEAFGSQCSPKTVARLYQFMKDPARFAALAKAWGCDTVRMLPGKRPGAVGDDGAVGDKSKGGDASARSPFNPGRKYDNDLDRQTECADYIRKHGTRASDWSK